MANLAQNTTLDGYGAVATQAPGLSLNLVQLDVPPAPLVTLATNTATGQPYLAVSGTYSYGVTALSAWDGTETTLSPLGTVTQGSTVYGVNVLINAVPYGKSYNIYKNGYYLGNTSSLSYLDNGGVATTNQVPPTHNLTGYLDPVLWRPSATGTLLHGNWLWSGTAPGLTLMSAAASNYATLTLLNGAGSGFALGTPTSTAPSSLSLLGQTDLAVYAPSSQVLLYLGAGVTHPLGYVATSNNVLDNGSGALTAKSLTVTGSSSTVVLSTRSLLAVTSTGRTWWEVDSTVGGANAMGSSLQFTNNGTGFWELVTVVGNGNGTFNTANDAIEFYYDGLGRALLTLYGSNRLVLGDGGILDDGNANITMSSFNILGKGGTLNGNGTAGELGFVGASSTRAWWEVNNLALATGTSGDGATVRLSEKTTPYWDVTNVPASVGSYGANDTLSFNYLGTNTAVLSLASDSVALTSSLTINGNTTWPQLTLDSTATDTVIKLNALATGGRSYLIDAGSDGSGVGAGNLALYDATAGLTRWYLDPTGEMHALYGATVSGLFTAVNNVALQSSLPTLTWEDSSSGGGDYRVLASGSTGWLLQRYTGSAWVNALTLSPAGVLTTGGGTVLDNNSGDLTVANNLTVNNTIALGNASSSGTINGAITFTGAVNFAGTQSGASKASYNGGADFQSSGDITVLIQSSGTGTYAELTLESQTATWNVLALGTNADLTFTSPTVTNINALTLSPSGTVTTAGGNVLDNGSGDVTVQGTLTVGGQLTLDGTLYLAQGTSVIESGAGAYLYASNAQATWSAQGGSATSPSLQIYDLNGVTLMTVGSGPSYSGTTTVHNTLDDGVTGDATFASTVNFVGGMTVSSFDGGTWINMPTTGPSAIGTGGAGSNPWVAYANAGGNYFNDSAVGDVIYRNLSGALRFGTNSTLSQVQLTTGGLSTGHGVALNLYGTTTLHGGTQLALNALSAPSGLNAALGTGAVGGDLVASGTYTYTLTGVTYGGVETSASAGASVTQGATALPVTLTWTLASTDTEYVNVYKNGLYLAQVTGGTTSYTDSGNTATTSHTAPYVNATGGVVQGNSVLAQQGGGAHLYNTTGYAFVDAYNNAYLSANAYWDGANWRPYTTGSGSSQLQVSTNAGGFTLFTTSGLATNPITFNQVFSVDGGGSVHANNLDGVNLNLSGAGTVSGALTVNGTATLDSVQVIGNQINNTGLGELALNYGNPSNPVVVYGQLEPQAGLNVTGNLAFYGTTTTAIIDGFSSPGTGLTIGSYPSGSNAALLVNLPTGYTPWAIQVMGESTGNLWHVDNGGNTGQAGTATVGGALLLGNSLLTNSTQLNPTTTVIANVEGKLLGIAEENSSWLVTFDGSGNVGAAGNINTTNTMYAGSHIIYGTSLTGMLYNGGNSSLYWVCGSGGYYWANAANNVAIMGLDDTGNLTVANRISLTSSNRLILPVGTNLY